MDSIELILLSTDPVIFYFDEDDKYKEENAGNIHPFTIRDIKNIGGETVFNSYISTLTINKDRLINSGDNNEEKLDTSDFELAYLLCTMDENFREIYLKAMSFVFKENVDICNLGFYVGELDRNRIINNKNYYKLIKIIKLQNCLEKVDSGTNQENPGSDKAKELLEKRKKLREKLNKIKNKNNEGSGEPLTLSDLVSILCANGNGVTIFNVWDLSFYAFNDQFNRMKMLDDYQVNVRSILAGADPNEIELKHWMSKIS